MDILPVGAYHEVFEALHKNQYGNGQGIGRMICNIFTLLILKKFSFLIKNNVVK